MRACIHRGSQQIGGSCVEVESRGQRLLLDLGLPLDAEGDESGYLPVVAGLDGSSGGRDGNLLGVLVSHAHLDHCGLLGHIAPEIPVGMGPAARRIMAAAAPFLPGNRPAPARGFDFVSGQVLRIGAFTVTPWLEDHSAYDAYALCIEADGRRLFYSGDLRAHGRKGVLFTRLLAHPPAPVDALLLEGSSIGRIGDSGAFPTEEAIAIAMERTMRATAGLALVHASAQNIDRVVTAFKASVRTGRTLVLDLYAAAILEATGNRRIPQSDWAGVALYVPQAQRAQVVRQGWYEPLRRHGAHRIYPEHLAATPERYTLLFRPLHCNDLAGAGCLQGAAYIYSQWEGYWERGTYAPVERWLRSHNIAKCSIHTSGHAAPGDLKRLVGAFAPRRVVPIHTIAADRYPVLFPNVEPHDDGAWWEV